MNNPDVDTVLNYLSIKFNKIFCDRDFVSSVITDFQAILKHKSRPCVLVFPTLGPIYLKALRYQARIFDLAVFSVHAASGRFRSLAVCHKDHLRKATQEEVPIAQSEMSSTSRRKRPERQLYVPPAQRRSRLSETKLKPEFNNNNNSAEAENNSADAEIICDQICAEKYVKTDCVYYNLSDLVRVFYATPKSAHGNCEFFNYLCLKDYFSDFFLPQFDNLWLSRDNFHRLNWRSYGSLLQHSQCAFPVFTFSTTIEQESSIKHKALLICDYTRDYLNNNDIQENLIYSIKCDPKQDSSEDNLEILDLAQFNLGHFFIIPYDNCEFFYECQCCHDIKLCYDNMKENLHLQNTKKVDVIKISEVEPKEKNNYVINTNIANENKNKNEHEQEKEIMIKTKKNINRRTKPIMKYVDDTNDILKIDKNDSVNNWEDLFDDNGQIQEEFLSEIVAKVGDDVAIVAASEDYTDYTNKPPEDLEHVVELYNFPATLATHDLIQAFSGINSDAMYVKWVDDTHALLVLGSLSQAQKAISMQNPLIKARPMTAASSISMDVANKSDLKPAMKRPETNLQTARRLITTHLGAKSKLTKEQIAKERQDLKNAREKKRMIKQNEQDAWEGNIRSSVK